MHDTGHTIQARRVLKTAGAGGSAVNDSPLPEPSTRKEATWAGLQAGRPEHLHLHFRKLAQKVGRSEEVILGDAASYSKVILLK